MRSPSSTCEPGLERVLLGLGKEFHDRRFPFAVFDLDEGESLCAKVFRNRRHLVDLADGDTGEALCVDRLHDPAALDHAAEHLETALAKIVGEIDQLHAKAAIGLVAAVGADRFAIGQAREGRRDVDPARRLENRGQHSLHQSVNVIRPDERGFDVDLGELRLAIGAQVFVAKAFRDLKIFFHPADHEQLLVLLRRLRERVEFARQDSAGDEEIARAFRCALGQDRRLDFDKALRHRDNRASPWRRGGGGAGCATTAGGADRSSDRSGADLRCSTSASSGKGRPSARFRIVRRAGRTSISPVASFGFSVPGRRGATLPSTWMTSSSFK